MMEHSHWTREITDTSRSTETARNSFSLDLSTTASSGQEHGSKPNKKDGQRIKAESSTQALSEVSSSLAAIMGFLIGWPLKATLVWALLMWAGLPLTLTWLQCLLVVAVIDILKA